jgi:Uma2 family endonuclease
MQLGLWARQDKRGLAFDSSTGWVLPNTARRSPDAAWVLKHRIKALDPESKTDRVRVLREKMEEWVANGAHLAWLIDPDARLH